MAVLSGAIIWIDLKAQTGTIRGDDRRTHRFSREAMVFWLHFLDLKPGTRVRYEVEASSNDAFNVELA